MEELKAELEFQRDALAKRSEAVKDLPMMAVQAIDQIDTILERCGIRIPIELQG